MEESTVSITPTMTHCQDLSKIRSNLGIPVDFPLTDVFIMRSLDILIWNCRGAGNDRFWNNFKHIMRTYKPEVVALLETKVSFLSMGSLFKPEGLTASAYNDPMGRVGGIWHLWNPLCHPEYH